MLASLVISDPGFTPLARENEIYVFWIISLACNEDILRAKKVSNVKRKLIWTDISKKIVFGKKIQKMSFLKISATKIGGRFLYI